MICYPEKCVPEVMGFFRFRFDMHSKVYQHKTTTAGAAMIVDILRKADPYYVISAGAGGDEQQYSISSAVINQDAFLTLKDTIIEGIKNSTSRDLEPARALAERFLARDLYKLAGELNIRTADQGLWKLAKSQPEEIVREICGIKGDHTDENGERVVLREDDVLVQPCSWHYGRKDCNPLSAVRFVHRQELCSGEDILIAHEIDEEDYETIIPRSFIKKCIRVYSRNPSKTDLLVHKFQAWKQVIANNATGTTVNTKSRFAPQLAAYASEVSMLENTPATNTIALTQDSEDEGSNLCTPIKNRIKKAEDASPIPLPSFHHGVRHN